MTFPSLARIFIAAANAGLQIGPGLLLTAMAMRRPGGERSGLRRKLHTAAMLSMLIAPLMSFFAPSLSLSFLSLPARMIHIAPLASRPASGAAVEIIPAVMTPVLSPFWSWAGAIWLAAAAILILRLVIGLLAARRIGKDATAVRDGRVRSLFVEAARIVGVRRSVGLLSDRKSARPTSLGLFRAAVILPAGMLSWTGEELKPVLRHELAHIKHGDHFWRVAARFLCAVAWFNPLAWIALRRLIDAQEIECDRAALRAAISPSVYAGILVKIVMGGKARLSPATASLDSGKELKARIRAILDQGRPRPGRIPALLLVPALAFFSLWDAASSGTRAVTVTVLQTGAVQVKRDDSIRKKKNILLNKETCQWDWF